MNLEQVQTACAQHVEELGRDFATLRRDINAAVVRVGNAWQDDFDSPADIPGMMYCTSVRGLLIVERMRREKAAIGGDAALTTVMGKGMSALLSDGRGMGLRVRRKSSNLVPARVRGQRELMSGSGTPEVAIDDKAEVGEQMCFHGGTFDRIKPSALVDSDENLQFDWFVLWSPDGQRSQVADAYFAAVRGIDDSQGVIYAQQPLPVLLGTGASAQIKQADDATSDDFNDLLKRDGRQAGGDDDTF